MPLPDLEIVMFAKLVLATVLAGLIGTERAVLAKQAAGTRTFALVSLGACLFIVVGQYIDAQYIGVLSFDPMRIAASVIMGIGFIGGGLIVFRGETVHGVTTAAGLWMAAGLGMTVGFGMYAVAIFATLLTLVVVTGMWYVEQRFKHWFGAAANDTQTTSQPQ